MSTEPLLLSALNAMDRGTFGLELGWVYENSAWIAEGAWDDRPYSTVDGLHAAMERVVSSAPPQKRLALIQAHPDLAGRLGALSELTVASQREQVGAGLNLLTLAEGEQMARLNASYREKFGFPFILCVRLNKLEAIREAFAKRLENDRAKEIELALKEISKIARLRLADAIS
jgi:OHCU decarboxylase